MTDSMKFGPEWLRNMSAEPTNATSGVGGGTFSSSPSHIVSVHNNSGSGTVSHTPASRNMFPEFRYGREEMLSLFDRNCILPQILTSYKKLFVEKVQYPLALTPSSEDDINTQGPSATTPRPSWLQRSPIGFSSSSRGTGRGGTVDRGRMRGKGLYHSLYQRPTALYEDSGSPLPLKLERGWSERNGTNETSTVPGASGNLGVDWNGTPTSSPRKEFTTQNRNTENWRRGRNDDGSGDGPVTGGISTTDGWRSNNSVSSGFGNNHRWVGRSTSWRDEESTSGNGNDPPGYSGINMQRSYSTIGTLGLERNVGSGFHNSNVAKSNTSGGVGNTSASSRSTTNNTPLGKSSQQWSTGVGGNGGTGNSTHEAEDNLPEWAMENPSDMGGTFDASGAFHGETGDYMTKKKTSENNMKENKNDSLDSKCQDEKPCKNNESSSLDSDGNDATSKKRYVDSEVCNPLEMKQTSASIEKIDEELLSEKENQSSVENSELCDLSNAEENSSRFKKEEQSDVEVVLYSEEAPKAAAPLITGENVGNLGDISDRLKEVADEVEKLIMDDDGGVIRKNNIQGASLPSTTGSISGGDYVSPGLVQMLKQSSQNDAHQTQHSESVSPNVIVGIAHKPLPFGDQLSMQQQQLVATAGIPPHMLNSNPNDMWYYRDPQSNVQGPFSAIEMTEWYRAGYFNENLFVRRINDSRFRPLGELIKVCHGNMPFTHSHLIPSSLELDSLQIVTNKSPVMSLSDQELQQQRNEEQLKGNVTAAANSLSSAVKNHINTVGMSHMLTMQFQMLQDQYMQHQEHHIMKELSKNDCFQRLSPPEREAIVRQKVQMLVLPEYLSSLNGLSNSLASLNPIAGTQLYDAIAEQAKKQQHQQQLYHGNGSQNQPRLEADDFILNAQMLHQQAQQQAQQHHVQQYGVASVGHYPASEDCNKIIHGGDNLSNNDLLNELNLRMFLRSGNSCQHQGKSNSGDYMTEPQLLSAPPAQNIMLPVWMPQFTSNTQPLVNANQSSQLLGPHQPHSSHWTQGSPGNQLVGMETADIPSKPMSITLWDVSALEEAQSQQVLQKQQQTILEHSINNMEFNGTIQHQQQDLQQKEQHQKQIDKSQQQVQIEECTSPQQQTQNKQRKDDLQPINQQPNVKQHNMGKQHQLQGKSQKIQEKTLGEEDRRREQAEEKRRMKEERKRQQLEEEKRRAHQIEDEKRRQIQEEKERQQQIQAQRRKALLGTSSNNTMTASKAPTKLEQQRSHSSSIAPWSLQTVGPHSVGPGLAEIQKAERRERRADLLRQQEQLDKQLRANTAETTEALLKWQSSAPTHVMSLAEIQAEEAKRLANDQLEQQRRREQEQQSSIVASSGFVGGSISGVSNIWAGSTKVWGGSAPTNSAPVLGTTTFWDESLKFNTTSNSGNASAAAVLTTGIQSSSTKQPQQSKISDSPSSRNLRKSQTMPTIQNATAPGASSAKSFIKSGNGTTSASGQVNEKNKLVQSKSQKPYEDKKTITKQNNGPNSSNSNKASEYENEFTIWCMKSLSNMSAKVDVPTFVTFLQDLEAPYEVKDYIRIYLGEGKESTDFAKQFLERRSKYKNLQRAQNAHNDDMCKPAPAITPSGNDNSDNKNKQKKIKKSKMTKLDARILGFSVTAAEGRINVGDRDYVDGP